MFGFIFPNHAKTSFHLYRIEQLQQAFLKCILQCVTAYNTVINHINLYVCATVNKPYEDDEMCPSLVFKHSPFSDIPLGIHPRVSS